MNKLTPKIHQLINGEINLTSQQLAEVCSVLSIHVPDITVWAFGSRVNGHAREYSDLDLALITTEPLSLPVKADLVACFEESNLPFKVDIIDWACTGDNFRNIIMAHKIVIHEGQP